ncbi:response regulator [Rubellimicrobium arenae]|uniref:response regulator n=1 Tax=Rubellimicrobium arenae TaxID=2817372 RepID=UPI001B314F0D|nr:response regulator [Rubellimicrobium arenae]
MEGRVLILAPRGRDAALAADLLGQKGMNTLVCDSLDALVEHLAEGAGAALVTEEALAAGHRAGLTAWVSMQPRWSDFPFIVLANGARAPRTAAAAAILDSLGNVLLLERPLHAEALLGAVRSALKARQRQYEVRAFAGTLEQSVADRTRELETARESLQIALDAAEMGSWDLDLVHDTARRTLRHDEIFGYAGLQPRWGREAFLRHVVPEERGTVAAAFDAALEKGVLEIECRIDAADGTSRWVALKGRVHRDPSGRPVRMTGVISDVTARKEADARLAQVAKMDSIGQLTGGVAHDFNNLLTPILGSLDILRRRIRGDARAERLLDGALQAAERAATLTQRLLAFSRRQTLAPQSVDLGALLDGIVELVRRSLGPTIRVDVEVAPDLPAARVDPNQLELALLNLAINARDAMPQGGRLSIMVDRMVAGAGHPAGLKPGPYVRTIVRDTGTGMDRATLAKAVEPFFSTKGVGRGTGLGLSMVHGLAAQSGGILELASEPGRGTVVTLWLPATARAAGPLAGATDEPRVARPGSTVLLVDDEELVRASTADMLRDLGYTVLEATSGARALTMLRSGAQVDLVVTDYLMPGMSGAALIQEIRQSGSTVPIVLITGYTNAASDVPGDVAKLAKPFRQVDLAARLAALLEDRPAPRPATQLRIVE